MELENDGDRLDRSDEKWSITKGQEEEEYPVPYNKGMFEWISHNLCSKCFLKRFLEGKIEGRI
jgi:hypothetical protein